MPLQPGLPPQPIADHAIVGDLHTVALVDTAGTIDFMCLPALDGPTVFASLLDPHAGSFSCDLDFELVRSAQTYVPDTNVVITSFAGHKSAVQLTDFMAIGSDFGESVLVRKVAVTRGRARIRVTCAPRFDYARAEHATSERDGCVVFTPSTGDTPLHLTADAAFAIEDDVAQAEFELEAGESRAFVLSLADDASLGDAAAYAETALAETIAFWRSWIAKSTYRGRWREAVSRSALTLKLLVSSRYGSVAAAATFGLPEVIGGERNWDYRYSWVRDASFAAYAFIRLGFVDEALAFMGWIGRSMKGRDPEKPMSPIYRLDGSTDIPETILDHFAGFGDSRPVRIGNAASDQLQLDVYGALMDAVYLTSKYGGAMSLDAWALVSQSIEWICDHWQLPDEGIWEARNGRLPLLHSRVQCWVAVDRAVRLAEKRSLPAPMQRWSEARTKIYNSIVAEFWNDELQSFVRDAGGNDVDASTLMLPLLRFIGGRDPRWISTQARIQSVLSDDGRVYRYASGEAVDGMPGIEGAFTTCSFWLVECLARSGETDEAHLLFSKMLGYANHVGLYAEELAPNGDHLGNFPQALTHLSLISAAFALDRALTGKNDAWQ